MSGEVKSPWCPDCGLSLDACVCGIELAEDDKLSPEVSDLMCGDDERDRGPEL